MAEDALSTTATPLRPDVGRVSTADRLRHSENPLEEGFFKAAGTLDRKLQIGPIRNPYDFRMIIE
jgi:hypothetical protein